MKTKSILLVDDEPFMLESLRHRLTSENLCLIVSVAKNAKDAIANINNGYYDLVVTDLMLPNLDGFQVLKAAKQWKNMQAKVIILTSDEDLKLAIDAMRLRADDYFLKPYNINDLVYRIGNCLVKQDLERKDSIYKNFLPVCSYCKKIRADQPSDIGKGPWLNLEEYFAKVNGILCSHGCCPECFEKAMPNFIDEKHPTTLSGPFHRVGPLQTPPTRSNDS